MRWNPFGRTWSRKRLMNSSARASSCGTAPGRCGGSPCSGRSRRARRGRRGGCSRWRRGGCSGRDRRAPPRARRRAAWRRRTISSAERREMRGEGLAGDAGPRARRRTPAGPPRGRRRARVRKSRRNRRESTRTEEEAGPAAHPARAVEREPAARHDHMDVRMVAPTPTIP